jgi:hypothetical protein
MDHTAAFDIKSGSGFVLNYGSLHNTPSNTSSGCNLSTVKVYGDGYSPCFRTADDPNGNDYAYAAWTTTGSSPWQSNYGSGCAQASTPAYNTTGKDTTGTTATPCVTPGKDLGITFYAYGSSTSRFKLDTNGMGFLFNGVLYAPSDEVDLGGGNDAQAAAGQIVGWTIKYHGGTNIVQNWYAEPQDGQPFLIEPVIGE